MWAIIICYGALIVLTRLNRVTYGRSAGQVGLGSRVDPFRGVA